MKKLIAILALGALVATGAFAELSLGVSGVQYYQEDANGNLPSLQQAWKDFQDGNGVYYGGFAELLGKHWGLGLAFNYDPEAGSQLVNETTNAKFMSYDVNLYLSYHLFGGAAFLDPFAELGFGVYAFDYKNKKDLIDNGWTIDADDPLAGTGYFTYGLGLGLNLKPIGVFIKANWVNQAKGVLKGTDDITGDKYDIPLIDVMPFRWTFGAKLLLF